MTTWCRPDSTVSPDPSNTINRFAPSTSAKRASASNSNSNSNNNKSIANGSYLEHPALIKFQREIPARGERFNQVSASLYSIEQRPASSASVSSSSAAASARHSIADILGWVEASTKEVAAAIKLDRLSDRERVEDEEDEEEEDDDVDDEDVDEGYDDDRAAAAAAAMMASDFVDMDVAYSDEPLDLSLDKSKSRRTERDFERTMDAATPIKRSKYHQHHHHHHHHNGDPAASDAGTDDGDAAETGAVAWNGTGIVQPHLQMAANFSTVLQYYLTAARLWQTSEAMRCHESQQHDSEGPSEPDAPPGDQTAAMVAAMAAAAAAAAAANASTDPAASLPVATPAVAPAIAKKRKKESTGGDSAPAALPVTSVHQQQQQQQADPSGGQNGAMRPRKTRTTFTGKQLFELERIFEQKKYLSSNERQEVARLLNVTGSQIKIWFQNRRTKWKKQDPNTAAELAQLKSASRSQQQQQQQQQQQHPAPVGSSSVTPTSGVGVKASLASKSGSDAADASASDNEAHSDDGSSHRSAASPSPPV